MPEYIEREAVLKTLNKNSITKAITFADGESIYDTIKNLPAADVAEVKHGHWERKPSRLGSSYKLYGCSLCGWTFTFQPDYNFCPRCGACMKEGAEE